MDSPLAPPQTATPVALGRRKRWLFGLLLVVGLYLLAEVCSYFAYWALDGKPFQFKRVKVAPTAQPWKAMDHAGQETGLYVLHPFLGVVYNPDWTGKLPYEATISEYGYADTGTPIHKRAPDKVIVGIVGGSVASIFHNKGTATLARELQRDSRFRGKKIEFVNLAVGGFKQPQQVISLNYALMMGGEFDVLLNIDGFNEVAFYPPDNLKVGLFPMYPRGWHFMATTFPDPFARHTAGEIAYLERTRQDWEKTFRQRPLRWSITAKLIWKFRDKALAADMARCKVELDNHRTADLPYHARGPRHHLANETEMYNELVTIWKRGSITLEALCRGKGITYYHFLQPNQYVPGAKPIGPEERKVAWLEETPLRTAARAGYPLLKKAGKELAAQGINFHDLSMIFANHKEPLYVDTCCHFADAGNEILAQAIAAAIMETPEPPTSPRLSKARE